MEQVEASVLGTVYRNEDNGYSVVTAREGRREITIVGTLPELTPGEQATSRSSEPARRSAPENEARSSRRGGRSG